MNSDQRNDALMRKAAALPEEIQPERDLWPAIAAEIDNAPAAAVQRPRRWLWAAAAGIALMALTASVTWQIAQHRLTTPPAEKIAALQQSATMTVNRADGDLHYMRAQLLDSLQANLSRLPADSQRIVVDNLLEIRTSLTAIEQALAADPANPSLQQLLYTTYEQELAVMADVNRIALSLPAEVEI